MGDKHELYKFTVWLTPLCLQVRKDEKKASTVSSFESRLMYCKLLMSLSSVVGNRYNLKSRMRIYLMTRRGRSTFVMNTMMQTKSFICISKWKHESLFLISCFATHLVNISLKVPCQIGASCLREHLHVRSIFAYLCVATVGVSH